MKDISLLREKHKSQKIVFCAGSFDLTHVGHELFFEDGKKHGDVLVVMVANDFNQKLYKGEERPILNQDIRLKMVDSLKPVDYALLDLNVPDKRFLEFIRDHIFKELKPDVYLINTDAFDMPMRHDMVKGRGVGLVVLDRACPPEFENISTTKIIEKIRSGRKNKE